MAKSKSFFGLRRGSTKTLTFSVNDGKQITKDRVYEVKNPRTKAQMIQRMMLATSSAAYSAMKEIVDHSFEGITYGQPNMSEFSRLNTKKLKEQYAEVNPDFCYNKYQNRQLLPGKYIMARGTASLIKSDGFVFSGKTDAAGSLDIKVAADVAAANLTANAVLSALGIGVGDMATFLIGYPLADESGLGFCFIRLKSLQSGTTAMTVSTIADYFAVESNVPVQAGLGEHGLVLEAQPADAATSESCMYCVVHSLKTANGWLRSNATMQLDSDMVLPWDAADALETYPIGGTYVLNGGNIE